MRTSLKTKYISIAVLCCLLVSCKQVIIQQPLTKVIEEEPGTISTETIANLLGLSFLIAIGFIALVFVIAQAVYKLESNKWKRLWDWLEGHLTQMFGLAWLFGFCVYSVGMFVGIESTPGSTDRFWHLFGVAPMAVIHAFGMFIMDSDVSAVHNVFHDNLFYMVLFSIAHFFAACVSLIFVIKHFGYNIVASIQMWLAAYGWKAYEQLFVFWGMNDISLQLARSIKSCGKVNGKYQIIFIRMTDDNEKIGEQSGLDRLFNFMSMKNEELMKIKELGCLTMNSYSSLSRLSEVDDNHQRPDILRDKMRLKSVVKIIQKTTGDVHMFFMSDDDKTNIQAVGNIKRDATINRIAMTKNKGKIKLYCHARYNSVHRVIEDEQQVPNVLVKVVDSSHISVELMKQKVELQPVSYVEVNPDATVNTPFKGLIVGFSEVGLDALRFLYEFGAFVKTGSTWNNVERSPFHCDVIDKKMDELAGLFIANAPSISIKCSFSKDIKEDNNDSNPLVTLHKCDALGRDFTNYLIEALKDKHPLNYVVIATENDELNISIGVRILRLAIRYRKDMKNLRIMVRVHHDEDKHILHIAEHYNRLWEANEKADGKKLHQRGIKSDANLGSPITLFGSEDSTYTYENIISEEIEEEAKRYKAQYDASINAQRVASGLDAGAIQTWDEEHNDLMQLDGDYKGYSPTFSGVMRLRRVQSQNKENCLHLQTKRKLASTALGEEPLTWFEKNKLFRESSSIRYTMEDGSIVPARINKLLDTLAETEHLRWNASHEVLGYVSAGDEGEKDEARLIHGCIRPWQELKDETKSYDYDVVDVSLGII